MLFLEKNQRRIQQVLKMCRPFMWIKLYSELCIQYSIHDVWQRKIASPRQMNFSRQLLSTEKYEHRDVTRRSFGLGSDRVRSVRVMFGLANFGFGSGAVRVEFGSGPVRVDWIRFGYGYGSGSVWIGSIFEDPNSGRFGSGSVRVRIGLTSNKVRSGRFGYGLGQVWFG